MPSLRYSVSGLLLSLTNGSTATESIASPRGVTVANRDAATSNTASATVPAIEHRRSAPHRGDWPTRFVTGRRSGPARLCVTPQTLQIRTQVGSVLVTERAVLFERPVDDLFEPRRHLRIHARRSDRCAVQDRVVNRPRRRAGKCLAPRRHLVEHRAKGEDIRPSVEGIASHLFR